MPEYPILDFIIKFPVIAFFIAWPIGTTLIGLAWITSSFINLAYANTITLFNQILGLLAVLFRGYPHKNSKLIDPVDSDTKPE